MAGTVKGPAIFLAQFAGDAAPFNSFDGMCRWAASLGYKGVQIPTWDDRLIDLAKAAESQTYCDEIAGIAKSHGLAITELATSRAGPTRRGESGLRRGVRRLRAEGGSRQAGGTAEMGGRADDERRQGVEASRPRPRTRPSPARSPGLSSIPGRSARRA